MSAGLRVFSLLWVIALLATFTGCSVAADDAAGDDDASDDDDAAGDDDAAPGPVQLFDAHIHYKTSDSVTAFLAMAEGAGLLGISVLGPANSWPLYEAHPDYVVPFLFPTAPLSGLVTEVSEGLAAGARGIGELSIRHFPAGGATGGVDEPADRQEFLDVYDLAANAGVPINIHFDYEEGNMDSFEAALAYNRNTTIIWAHAGDGPPSAVGALLDAHPNLRADLSCRNPFYLPRHTFTEQQQSIAELDRVTLREDWKEVLEQHSDRFLFGTDIGPGDRDSQIGEVVPWYQQMLGQLAAEHAEAIANGNARSLLALD